ncbi:MAG: hypothetical protein J6W43_03270 [Prevotella sp.]|nr:hypothetical protein [Prevotella sp.]
MKKLILLLLVGLLMAPSEMFAEKYHSRKVLAAGSPFRTPSQYSINLYLNENTGYLVITPNDLPTWLNITITGNGITYLNTTIWQPLGQSYTDYLDYLPVGTYLLNLSTVDGLVDQYEITVEPD